MSSITSFKKIRCSVRTFVILGGAVFWSFAAQAQNCATAPANLVAWWQAENNAMDSVGSATGTLVGGETFGPGEAGRGFSGDGVGNGVLVTNATALRLQSLTIEGWVRRGDLGSVSGGSGGNGILAGFGDGGYALYLNSSGNLIFNKIGDGAAITSPGAISDLNFHHVAVSLGGSALNLYIDGARVAFASYNPTFSFTGGFGIGYRPDNNDNSFIGTVDEVSIYSRALSTAEILGIYDAGSAGKCATFPPVITTQPVDQAVFAGGTAVFPVTTSGNQPISYYWSFDGNNIPSETNATLIITDLQPAQAGVYSVTASNAFGSVMSSNVFLTVKSALPCFPLPAGIVGWWRAEADAKDAIGNGDGILMGAEGFGAGEAGLGFTGDGNGGGVLISNTTSLRLQTLTIETWVKRGSASALSHGSGGNAIVVGFGPGGYVLYLNSQGQPVFDKLSAGTPVTSPATITDTSFHHLAVTLAGEALNFYLDGTNAGAAVFGSIFTFTGALGIGCRPDNLDNGFLGTIDEASIYNRALEPGEIQSIYATGQGGKCPNAAPFISAQPTDQTVYLWLPAVLSVSAHGTPPLHYQWTFNGASLTGATNSTLNIAAAQFSQAGPYFVVISNAFGTVTSSIANLTVVFAPPCLPPPAGLAGWWRGENSAYDYSGNNADGTLVGNDESYATGEVGVGFSGSGSGTGVLVTNTTALRLQTLTIEAWVKRGSATVISHGSAGNAVLVGFGNGGYAFYLDSSGHPIFDALGDSGPVTSPVALSDTSFHHLAVTFGSAHASIYIDGTNVITAAYGPVFTFGSGLGIGFRPDNSDNSFLGVIDEVSIYNRALGSNEVQAIYNAAFIGKCYTATAPIITRQPVDQFRSGGGVANLSVAAVGAPPLAYQWFFEGAPVPGATNAALVITSLEPSDDGVYSVVVTNALGSTTSSNAIVDVSIVAIYANGKIQTNSPVLFSGIVTVNLTNYYGSGDIFYTLDGSTPTPFSPIYSGPIVISNSVVITTLAYSGDFRQFAFSDPFFILIVPGYSLTATTPGGGTITVSPLTNSYASNSLVTVTAKPAPGWTFLQWSGDAFGINPTNTVRLTRDKSVQAIFGTTVARGTNSGGTIFFDPPGPLFPYGTVIAATAVPFPGNEFVLWGEDASGSTNPLPFAVLAPNPTISALFIKTPTNQFSLTVLAQGGGRVTITPQANSYAPGQSVTITAVPDPGNVFLQWSDGTSASQNPYTVVMNQNRQLYAYFSNNDHLSISLYDTGGDDAGIQLDLFGQIGQHFRLDSSTNLNLWTPLIDATNSAGTLHYFDPGITNQSAKFYRAIILP